MKKNLLITMSLFCFAMQNNSFAQITRTADICTGTCSSNIAYPFLFNGDLYFQANSATNGAELWMYDGINTPSLVLDINPGAGDSNPRDFLIYNSKLYFSAVDGTNGRQLWVYDGTTTPSMVFNFGANFASFAVLQNVLYVLANNKVWKYDESANPSSLANLSLFGITGGVILGATASNLYFTATKATTGTEIWRYTGTGLPVEMEIRPGTGSSMISTTAIAVGTNFYFFANNGTSGNELWVHTGTGSPSLVYDINSSGNGASGVGEIANLNGTIYFRANDGINGEEVWKYDGTNTPTMLADINSGAGSSDPAWFYVTNNMLYFNASDNTHGAELWKYDGVSSPVLIKDVVSGTGSFNPEWLFEFNTKIYMRGDGNDGSGIELWEYDPSIIVDEDAPIVTFSPANSSTGVLTTVLIRLNFNESIRLINDDAVDNINVDDLIELRLNDAAGELVPFDAIINDYNEIVITPNTDLLNSQVYYVAIKENVIEDVNDNPLGSVQSAIFTTEIPTSIVDTESIAKFKIYPNPVSSGMKIHVDNEEMITKYRVTNSFGIILYEGSTLNTITKPGIYYIEIESEGARTIQKVIVQ